MPAANDATRVRVPFDGVIGDIVRYGLDGL